MKRIFGSAAAALAALSLAVTPAVAAQAPASKLSLRAATQSGDKQQLAGTLLAIIGAAVVVGVIVVVVVLDDDDPDSP